MAGCPEQNLPKRSGAHRLRAGGRRSGGNRQGVYGSHDHCLRRRPQRQIHVLEHGRPGAGRVCRKRLCRYTDGRLPQKREAGTGRAQRRASRAGQRARGGHPHEYLRGQAAHFHRRHLRREEVLQTGLLHPVTHLGPVHKPPAPRRRDRRGYLASADRHSLQCGVLRKKRSKELRRLPV